MWSPELGRQLRTYRKSLGLTLTRASERCSINQTTISKYERGKTKPSDLNASRLAKLYTVDISEIYSLKQSDNGDKRVELPKGIRKVPLKMAVKSRSGSVVEHSGSHRDVYEYISGVTEKAYGLIVQENWMSPTLINNDILIMEPGQKTQDRELVLVKNKITYQPSLRLFRKKLGKEWLASLSSADREFDIQAYKFESYAVRRLQYLTRSRFRILQKSNEE